MNHEELSQLTDRQLLFRTSELVQHERDHSITIIHHLREIRERGLHVARGYSSLFDYAVKALRYSDGAAYRRLQTLKLCEAHPEVEERLRSGALSLTTAAQLQTEIERREKRRRREEQRHPAPAPRTSDTAALGPAGTSPAPELTFQPQPAPEQQPATALLPPAPALTAAAPAPQPQPRPISPPQAAPRRQPAPTAPTPAPAPAPQPRPLSQLTAPPEQPAPTAPLPAPAVAPEPQPACQAQAAPPPAPTAAAPPPGSEPQRTPESQPQSPPHTAPEAARNRDLIKQAEGQSSRQVARLIADLNPESTAPRERLRSLSGGRWELRVVVDDTCHAELELLRAVLSHVNPSLSYGELLARLVADGANKYDPRRQTGRAAAAKGAGSAANPTREQEATSAPKPAVVAAATATATNPVREREATSAPKPAGATAEATAAAQPVASTGADLVADLATAAPQAAAAAAAAGSTANPAGAAIEIPAVPKPAAAAETGSAANRAVATADAAAAANPTPAREHRPPVPPTSARATAPPAPQRPGQRHPDADPAHCPPPVPPRRAAKPVSRTVPAELRRYIWRRDEGACSFVDPDTKHRCGSQHLLQIDHIQPFAMGGTTTADNLQLLCGAHNRHRARKSFGERRAWGAGGGR